jgi:hypothetical protein
MKIFNHIILSVIILHLVTESYAQHNSTAFYIVAHQDDWQLFMGKNAWDDINDPYKKVVIVTITAGDACTKTGTCKGGIPYFASRESGSKASVLFAKNDSFSVPAITKQQNFNTWFNNHEVSGWKDKNVTHYFLRLPDGRLHYDDSNHGDCGFDFRDSSYLNLFRRGHLNRLSNITGTATWPAWTELTSTVQLLIKSEIAGDSAIIHTHEYSPALNPATHVDHRETGLLVSEAAINLPKIRIAYHIDYASKEMTPNLSSSDIQKGIGLFNAYNKTKMGCGCPTDWSDAVIPWCSTNYISRQIPAKEDSGISSGKSGIIVTIFPNPASGNSTFSIVLPENDNVTCSVFDIGGKKTECILDNQLLLRGVHSLGIRKLPLGVYVLKLWTKSGFTLYQKVVFN